MRGGLGLSGVLNLQRFVEAGGTLITLTNSSALPIHFGLAEGVRIRETEDLWAPGGVFRATTADPRSPIAYGYDAELGVYFRNGPVFALGGGGGFGGFGGSGAQAAAARRADDGSTTARRSGRGGVDEEDIIQGRRRDLGRAGVEEFQRGRRQGDDPPGLRLRVRPGIHRQRAHGLPLQPGCQESARSAAG